MSSPRVLFVLKRRDLPFYDVESGHYSMSSGLINSAKFIADLLKDCGIDTKLIQVIDNNCIDREVTKYRPTHVIIEAFWVVPEKFEVLTKLHPDVNWIVRAHSEVPFLAQEGISVEWIFGYLNYPRVKVAFNSQKTASHFRGIVGKSKEPNVMYLPNYYPLKSKNTKYRLDNKDIIDVGCFGAIRPLKNQLIQAMAAIHFAKKNEYILRFHINGDRKESGGEPALRNIRELFKNQKNTALIEHPWYSHSKFLEIVRTMDIGLQVSFTESFNIVAADFVDNGVPVVTSAEIGWSHRLFHADETCVDDIVDKMERALIMKKHLGMLNFNYRALRKYSHNSMIVWLDYFSE